MGIYIKPQLSVNVTIFFSVVSYWESTSNHNRYSNLILHLLLYLIGNLHQTTTTTFLSHRLCRCILLGIYIKPQQTDRRDRQFRSCILLGIYIKPQPFSTAHDMRACCILLGIYIKPQHLSVRMLYAASCILLGIYIKPQLRQMADNIIFRCILLGIYIKPQHRIRRLAAVPVVSYWESTSNHNKY